jgi:putative N-acetylmannosamine-6-phosphate epimerase
MVRAIHEHGARVVADVSTESEAIAASEFGADYVATTLFGTQNYNAIKSMRDGGLNIIAEGNIRTPHEARLAVEAGAELVCVGSAISRPHHVTQWFLEALSD